MDPLFILFLVILLLKMIPAFAPPTWMVFSYLGFRYPEHAGWTLALVAALSTCIRGSYRERSQSARTIPSVVRFC